MPDADLEQQEPVDLVEVSTDPSTQDPQAGCAAAQEEPEEGEDQ
jgi:hypothetical protein